MSIKIENTQVFGWEGAIRGARNPMNSWEKSDSNFLDHFSIKAGLLKKVFRNILKKIFHAEDMGYIGDDKEHEIRTFDSFTIGPNDYRLLMNLCKGGTEEAKWRRMIHVQMDVTAPLYWWKEFETYKVGTVSNSCSTMHKIQAKEFTFDDFSCEHLFKMPDEVPDFEKDKDLVAYKEEVNTVISHMRDGVPYKWPEYVESAAEREVKWHYNQGAYIAYTNYDPEGSDLSEWAEAKYSDNILLETIEALNHYREKFLETKDKKYWWQMIQLLPSSFNQRRTIDLNYEVLASQYHQRKEHKLDEWREYCEWIKTLPYSEFITMKE